MFTIKKPTIDTQTQSMQFHFECEQHGVFTETIRLPGTVDVSTLKDDETANRLLDILGAYLGVSYYKVCASGILNFEGQYTVKTKESIQRLYTDGLGEFYIRNALNYPPEIQLNYINDHDLASLAVPESALRSSIVKKATVAFGGGKDSHVAISIFDKMHIPMDVVSVVLAESVQDTLVRLAGRDIIFIHRKIDPKLITLVKQGVGYNGHVPITAINSLILAIYSYAAGNDWVVFSNERGASIPTMVHHGHPVNHQYSKSLKFEELLRGVINDSCGDRLQYFSLLRPRSELWIASYLARHATQVHQTFSSCNRNFVFEGNHKNAVGQRWCGRCSKCVYTSIIMAPHLPKTEFIEMFQGDLLNEPQNLQTAKDLCGIGDAKPWECVGDFEDTASCMVRLSSMDDWQDDYIPHQLRDTLIHRYGLENLKRRFDDELSLMGDHFIPDQIMDNFDTE